MPLRWTKEYLKVEQLYKNHFITKKTNLIRSPAKKKHPINKVSNLPIILESKISKIIQNRQKIFSK